MCIRVYPVIEITKKINRCVYEIVFPDNSYYIGSTKNLFQRISGYKYAFNNSPGNINKRLSAKYDEFGTYEIIILEVVSIDKDPRDKEHEYILMNSNNSNFLNRSMSAFNNSGMIKKR